MSIPSDCHLRALIIHHSATLSVERAKREMADSNSTGPVSGHVMSQILDGSWVKDLAQAKQEVEKMIHALRHRPIGPNPYKDLTDDQIAKEIIHELAEKKGVMVKV